MKSRLLYTVTVSVLLLFVQAVPAFAVDGHGWIKDANDKVVTAFGMGLIVFFTLLVVVLSTIQGKLAKRKKK